MLIEPIDASPASLLSLAAGAPHDFPVFFDSAAEGPLAEWSLLAALPTATLRLRGDGRLECRGIESAGGFLDTLDRAWRRESLAAHARVPVPGAAGAVLDADAVPPFRGGWVVFLGYEMARETEPGLRLPAPAADDTMALAWRVPALLAWDHRGQRAWLLAEEGGAARLADLRLRVEGLRRAAADRERPRAPPPPMLLRLTEDEPARFLAAVRAARAYIAAGDIYQANLSRGWHGRVPQGFDGEPLYAALRRSNPAPFAAWLQAAELQLLSSSPERLVRTRGRRVETRPIAGTRPRLGDPEHAAGEIAALLGSAKERAEHTMLIDLERNDLGRVCEGGSVRVDEWMVTESYAHVHHIVSNVSGRLREDVTPVDVLRALFPGGTITGCPKYRCMQIIAELEGAARGPYTGSLGYINRDGDMDFSILIRTLSIEAGEIRLRAGAGIVADSDPEHELAETRAKARGLLRALGAP